MVWRFASDGILHVLKEIMLPGTAVAALASFASRVSLASLSPLSAASGVRAHGAIGPDRGHTHVHSQALGQHALQITDLARAEHLLASDVSGHELDGNTAVRLALDANFRAGQDVLA
jgi:hypothetical protein